MEEKTERINKYYTKKVKPINDITVKVPVSADTNIFILDRLGEQNRIISKLQRRLNGWWSKETDNKKRFILVTDYGNLDKGKNTFSYKIDLSQLNLSQEEIDRFTEGVKTKVREFLDDYEKDI